MRTSAARGIVAVRAAVTVAAGLAGILAGCTTAGSVAGSVASTARAEPPPSSLTWHAPVRADGTRAGQRRVALVPGTVVLLGI